MAPAQPPQNVAALFTALAADGLNLTGVASAAAWDAVMPPARQADLLLPGTRSILVFGSGGGALWDALLADLRRDPRGLTEEAHPLDAFVQRRVRAADGLLGGTPRRWFWTSADADVHLDFRLLANLAGLGAQSRMGLLIHPRWGTWVGLRAACFLTEEVSAATPVPADVCAGCPAPCVTACPGNAFPKGRWDVDSCGAFHFAASTCERSCVARTACPVGERYSPEEIAYHMHRASGREWLRAHLGIPPGADRFEGVGPHWGDWRARVDVKGAPA
jgi:epoxyqueuosine reductase QueG